MSFHPVAPRTNSAHFHTADATVKIGKPTRTGLQQFSIVFKRTVAPGAWKNGTMLEVAYGSGAERGKVRIAAIGAGGFASATPRNSTERFAQLRVPGLPDGIDRTPRRVACAVRGPASSCS